MGIGIQLGEEWAWRRWAQGELLRGEREVALSASELLGRSLVPASCRPGQHVRLKRTSHRPGYRQADTLI